MPVDVGVLSHLTLTERTRRSFPEWNRNRFMAVGCHGVPGFRRPLSAAKGRSRVLLSGAASRQERSHAVPRPMSALGWNAVTRLPSRTFRKPRSTDTEVSPLCVRSGSRPTIHERQGSSAYPCENTAPPANPRNPPLFVNHHHSAPSVTPPAPAHYDAGHDHCREPCHAPIERRPAGPGHYRPG